jgi:hypothetical protein
MLSNSDPDAFSIGRNPKLMLVCLNPSNDLIDWINLTRKANLIDTIVDIAPVTRDAGNLKLGHWVTPLKQSGVAKLNPR